MYTEVKGTDRDPDRPVTTDVPDAAECQVMPQVTLSSILYLVILQVLGTMSAGAWDIWAHGLFRSGAGPKQVALLLCVKWRVHWNVVLENGQSLLKTCWSLLRCTCRNVMWKIFFYTGVIIEVQFLIIPPVGAISLIFHKSLNLFSL